MQQSRDSELRANLMYLRKGVGISAARLRQTRTVLETLGLLEQPQLAQQKIASILEEMGLERQDVRALANAYGLINAPAATLGTRRERFASESGIRSTDTVENWENRALDELALRLTVAPVPEDFATRNAYMLRRLDMEQIVDRGFSKVVMKRDVVALRDGLDTFKYGTATPDIARIVRIDGAEIVDHQVNRDGQMFTVGFPRVLKQGESIQFDLHEVYQWDYEAEAETFVGQTFTLPTQRFRLRVGFNTKLPGIIWSYRNLQSPTERPGKPTPESRIRPKRSVKSVSADLRVLHSGLASGIAWRW